MCIFTLYFMSLSKSKRDKKRNGEKKIMSNNTTCFAHISILLHSGLCFRWSYCYGVKWGTLGIGFHHFYHFNFQILLVGSLTNDDDQRIELQNSRYIRTAYVSLSAILIFTFSFQLLLHLVYWFLPLIQNLQILSGLLLVPLCLALSVLLGWHIYLVIHNKTTIEVEKNFDLSSSFSSPI